MSIRVSGCYYHPDRGAVAVCDECGVGVCNSCAVKADGRILCKQCAKEDLRRINKELKHDHQQYQEWLKERGGRFVELKDFIRPGLIGLLLAIAAVILGNITEDSIFKDGVLTGIAMMYWLFSAPFCYTLLGTLIAPTTHIKTVFWELSMRQIIKLFISMLTGWIVFPIIVIRFIVGKVKAKKENSNQDS